MLDLGQLGNGHLGTRLPGQLGTKRTFGNNFYGHLGTLWEISGNYFGAFQGPFNSTFGSKYSEYGPLGTVLAWW